MKRRWESTKQQQMLLRSHRASRSSPSALLRGEGEERRRSPGWPRSPRGGREEGARRPAEAARLPPSFPPSPGRGPHQPFPAADTSRGGSPGLLGGPQTKEGRKRGRTGARRRRQPGSPRASAATASVCAQPGPTPAAGEVTRRAPSQAGVREGRGGRSGGGRRREERGRWLTRIRLKRLLSLGGSGTDGMARAALGQARLAGVGAAREGRLSVRGTGGGGEHRGGKARTRRGGGGSLTHSPAPPALPAGSPGPLCAAAGAPRRPPDAAKWPPGSPRRRRSAAPLTDSPSVRPAPGQGVRIPSVIPCAIPGVAAAALRSRRSSGRLGEPGCPQAWEGGGVGKKRSLCRRRGSERLCGLAVPWLVFKETTANLAARLEQAGTASVALRHFQQLVM